MGCAGVPKNADADGAARATISALGGGKPQTGRLTIPPRIVGRAMLPAAGF
jgi:hypothetical protein